MVSTRRGKRGVTMVAVAVLAGTVSGPLLLFETFVFCHQKLILFSNLLSFAQL